MTQTEYLDLRKKEHIKHVPKCRNQDRGKCLYTNNSCWFIHSRNDIIENKNGKETNEKRNNLNSASKNNDRKNSQTREISFKKINRK